MKNKFFVQLTQWSLRSPKTILCLGLVLAFCSLWGLMQTKVDNRIEIWFPKDSPALQNFEKDRQELGEDRIFALGFSHSATQNPHELAFKFTQVLGRDSATSSIDFPLSPGMAPDSLVQKSQFLIGKEHSFRLLLHPRHSWSEKDLERIAHIADSLAQQNQLQFYPLGVDWLNRAVNLSSTQESGLYTGLCYGLIFTLLIAALGLNRRMGFSLIALVWTLIVSLSLFGLSHTPLNIVSLIVPVLVLITSVAALVHLNKAWREKPGDLQHLALILEASFWSMLTTALGLLSTCLSSMPVLQQFGAFAAAGVLLGWISLLVIALPLLQIFPPKDSGTQRTGQDSFWSGISHALATLSLRRPGLMLCFFGLLVLLSLFGLRNLKADNQASSYLPAKHPALSALHWHEQEFGPSQSLRLELKGNAVNLSSLLMQMSTLDQIQVQSWRILGDRIWVELGTYDAPASTHQKTIDELNLMAQRYDFTLRASGYLPLSIEMSNLVVKGQVQSLLMAFGLIFPLIGLMLGGWRVLLAAVLPNLIPVVVTLAAMASLGIALDIGTAILGALLLGLVVDNTLHLILHWKARGMTPTSILQVYKDLGPSMIPSTLILLCGFSVLSFAEVSSLRSFGLLISIGFGTGLICEMLLTPLCLSWIAKKES